MATERDSETSEIVKIELIQSVEGFSLYFNGYRIAGPKPWAGGSVVSTWEVPMGEVKKPLGFGRG